MPVRIVLGRSVVSFLAIFFFFLRLYSGYSVRTMIDSDLAVRKPVCTLYSKLTCGSRDRDGSIIYYARTAVYCYNYTRYNTSSAVVALYAFVKVTD